MCEPCKQGVIIFIIIILALKSDVLAKKGIENLEILHEDGDEEPRYLL